MKPSKIYVKIFISFLLILIVTEAVIFALFVIYIGSRFREHDVEAKVSMVRRIIEEKLQTDVELSRNTRLKEFIRDLGQILNAQVWLQASGGEVLAKSFQGSPPKEHQPLKSGHAKDFGHFKLYYGYMRSSGLYAVVPIELQERRSLSLHVLFAGTEHSHPEEGFALGLGIIGVVIAVLVIPVSRFISKPINQLRDSAHRIAEGELSHRAPVKRKDEIGELAHAFNYMADRLEKMIRGSKELTAYISHELRTPLTRIRIAEEILREKLEQQNGRDLDRYLNDIREDVEELDSLIGRILMLSKLDMKEKPLRMRPVSPAEFLKSLLTRLKPAADQKGLSVTSDISFAPTILGDQDALQTAFSNILENAVKYSPSGGRLSVRTKPGEGAMEITVTNTAQRIPEKDLGKIFEPFHRLGTGGEAGFGLGLAIVRKIIEAHGGTTKAQSTEEGFTIAIRLPQNPTGQRGVRKG
jgi:two-component system sensor histidine kinase CpxA